MERGSLVYINYTLRIKGEDKVIETTYEDVAKQAGVHNPEMRYEPVLVAVGERWVVPGLDDALLGMSEGEKRTLEVPPEKGYGQRDPAKVKLIPLRKFGEDASRIRVGDQVDVDGQVGVVSYVGSGRVAIDFNHRLAGKTLVYDVEIVRLLKDAGEKVKALVAYALRMRESDVSVSIDGSSATVTLPAEKQEEGSHLLRRIAASYVFKYVPELRRVVFQEIYERPPEESQPRPEAAPSESEAGNARARRQRSEGEAPGPQATPSSSTSEQA
ncbi:MAG: FKBP-type peptidyl-prolyl cis-trans isomerase [Conexivisphaera sp.]